ncbi:MAG: endonuclease/exonuclease/phosphatase family protein [Candidatus Hydrogenedentes bacterium]|nr:endonuclease/exonuclease/phosphatase family protein [Candidatus Hydrogenedentota bacterium]
MQTGNAGPIMDTAPTARSLHTALFAVFFLFFIQLWGVWVENVFRMSLIELAMGPELLSLLFVLSPVAVVLVPAAIERPLLKAFLGLVVLIRAVCPILGAAELVVVAGIGVGASLVVFCYMLSGRYKLPGGHAAAAIGLALLVSIAMRTWGSSSDISLNGAGAVVGWLIAAFSAVLLIRTEWPERTTEAVRAVRVTDALVGPIGLFANFLIVYLALSSSAVIAAWTGGNYLAIVAILLAAWTIALWQPFDTLDRLAKPVLLVWNAAFVLCLVIGILIHTPDFPAHVNSPVLIVGPPSLASQVSLYLMCVLSPIVYLNIRAILERGVWDRPRAMAFPVVLAAAFMLAMTLCLVFTNTWGYVGAIGQALRGKFYLPFSIAGGVMVLSLAPIGGRQGTARSVRGVPRWAPMGLAVLAVVGVIVRGHAVPHAASNEKRLTILTYNIQLGSEDAGDRSYAEQLALIKRIDADIIGLQESDTARPSGGNVDAPRYFADALGYHMYFGPATVGGTYGTAILSRFPIEAPRTIYSYSDIDEIATSVAEFEVAGRRIAFFNSHPDGSDDAKQVHINALIDAARVYDHVIAVGDYNFRQGSPWYADITKVLKDSWLAINPSAAGPRHPSIRLPPDGTAGPLDMTRRIDHIFVSDSFKVEESYYIPPPESMTDHPAHWSVLSWE